MLLDLREYDPGQPFKLVGGQSDGEQGQSSEYWYTLRNGEFVDDFAAMTADHVRIDLGPVATYVPESMWRRMGGG